MTVPRWDARQFHHARRFPGEPTSPTPRRKRRLAFAALGSLMALAVVVSATQAAEGDDKVAICHATGSADQPYVYLLVSKDGFEHGHHRHHGADFFPQDPTRGCASDDVPAPWPDANETEDDDTVPEEPAEGGNDTAPEGGDGQDPVAEDEAPVEDGADANETVPEDSGNEPEEPAAEEGSDANETLPEEDGNQSEPEPAPLLADAAVRQVASQDAFEVRLTVTVRSAGNGVSRNVSLEDDLPDVRRTWDLRGPDAQACVLDGQRLSCWFGELAPGEERVVELRAFTDRMPCGFPLTNTALVSADDDVESRNDASSASIAARAC